MRVRRRVASLCCACVLLPMASHAAESWGGSLAATSDYLVRGISRSDQNAAIQADLHVATVSGLIAGVFASSIQFDAGDHRSAEFSGFLGFAWQASEAWRARVLASYYGYAWNDAGSRYDYAELAIEASYDDWLAVNLVYSPDAPHYVSYRGLTGVSTPSADISLRTPWFHRVAASAGVGFSHLAGPAGGSYAYWSAGGTLDLAPLSVTLSFIDTDAEARALFGSAAARERWSATIMWRF